MHISSFHHPNSYDSSILPFYRCSLYYNLHSSARPISMKSDIICSQHDACTPHSSLAETTGASSTPGMPSEPSFQIQTPSASSNTSRRPTPSSGTMVCFTGSIYMLTGPYALYATEASIHHSFSKVFCGHALLRYSKLCCCRTIKIWTCGFSRVRYVLQSRSHSVVKFCFDRLFSEQKISCFAYTNLTWPANLPSSVIYSR